MLPRTTGAMAAKRKENSCFWQRTGRGEADHVPSQSQTPTLPLGNQLLLAFYGCWLTLNFQKPDFPSIFGGLAIAWLYCYRFKGSWRTQNVVSRNLYRPFQTRIQTDMSRGKFVVGAFTADRGLLIMMIHKFDATVRQLRPRRDDWRVKQTFSCPRSPVLPYQIGLLAASLLPRGD